MPERYIVVGGGLAGLMTALKLAEAGKDVDIISFVPVKRSHSVCAQGGINGAVNTKGEGDHPDIHVKDTLRGGDFLAEQAPVKGMCYAAPSIIYLFDRMGVTFNRTNEGLLDFRRFGGTLHHRTAFAGATTGQQLLYALDEQVRRYEVEGRVRKFEYWEYLGFVKDEDGACKGVVAMDLRTMEIRAFPGDAVCLATGGPGLLFLRSTNSMINTGTACASAYMQGAWYGNGEFIQVHPTAIPGEDKLRLMSESARGEGGRIWVPSDGRPGLPAKGQPWYFLEEKYPKYKNLVPRDIASREIFHVCREMKLGVDGQDQVYLDVSHIPADVLDKKIGGILEIYEKFVGDDPHKVPMRIFPAVHYSMGGLWHDFESDKEGNLLPGPRNHATNIPGLYVAGEADYGYHGANRLGANSLLSCVYAGMITGPAMIDYAKSAKSAVASSVLDNAAKQWKERFETLYKMTGKENPYRLHVELGMELTEHTVVRQNDRMKKGMQHVDELMARWKDVNVLDSGRTMNQAASFVNQLWNMLELAKVVLAGAIARDESRGSHYKPEFALPEPKTRDPREDSAWMKLWKERDKKWRKTTLAKWTPAGPALEFKDIPTPILDPEPRWYG